VIFGEDAGARTLPSLAEFCNCRITYTAAHRITTTLIQKSLEKQKFVIEILQETTNHWLNQLLSNQLFEKLKNKIEKQ